MINCLLKRERLLDDRTIGKLSIGDLWQCWSMEDKVREIEGRPVEDWKIHGITAIPRGRYRVAVEDSPRFGRDTLTILNVPGFKYIRIHAGNKPEDTEGCILVGKEFDEPSKTITHSRDALRALKDWLVPYIKSGEEVWITVA